MKIHEYLLVMKLHLNMGGDFQVSGDLKIGGDFQTREETVDWPSAGS